MKSANDKVLSEYEKQKTNQLVDCKDNLLNKPFAELGVGDEIIKKLSRIKVYTPHQLSMVGISPVLSVGVRGAKLNSLISALENSGIDTEKLFYSKETMDEKKMTILNLPLTKVFDSKRILKILFSNELFRVKDMLYISDQQLARMLYKCGDTNAYHTGAIIKNAIYDRAGVRLNKDKQIVFNAQALKMVIPLTEKDDVIFERDDIPYKLKTILFNNDILEIGDLEGVTLDELKGVGTVLKLHLSRLMDKFGLTKLDEQNHESK